MISSIMLGVWCVCVVLRAYGVDVGCVWCWWGMRGVLHVCGVDEVCVCCWWGVRVLLMGHACVADEVGCVSATRVYNVIVP